MSHSEPLSFESLVQRLEALVTQLEDGELSLEAALEAYQEGVGLAREGHARLQAAEQRIAVLSRDGGVEPIAPSDDVAF